jgi:hypothetical protein
MKRILCLATVMLLGGATPSWAITPFVCLNHGIHCICPPPPDCEDCSCPCDHGFHFCSCKRSEHAHKLIDELNSACCCDRIKAAEKLGSRLHADFCCDPEVLAALSHALLCDTCWEVRRAAAWGIAGQKARTNLGVMSLYISSKIDPHYLVRDAATDALTELLVCRRNCFRETFAQADAMVKTLKGKYRPGNPDCIHLFDDCLSGCGMAPAMPAPAPAPALPPAKTTQRSITTKPGAVTLQTGELQPAPIDVTPR